MMSRCAEIDLVTPMDHRTTSRLRAYLPRAPLPLVVGILLVTSLPAAATPPQDDTGSGADAPDAMELAIDVSTGTSSGQLVGSHDVADWYRALVPAGKALVVELRATGDGRLSLRSPDDNREHAPNIFWRHEAATSRVVFIPAVAGSLRFAVEMVPYSSEAAIPYEFSVALADAPDVLVETLGVSATPSPIAPATVSLRISNAGAASVRAFVQVHAVSRVGGTAIYAGEHVLAAGAAVDHDVAWNGFPHAGKTEIRATVMPADPREGDLDRANDPMQASTFVIANL